MPKVETDNELGVPIKKVRHRTAERKAARPSAIGHKKKRGFFSINSEQEDELSALCKESRLLTLNTTYIHACIAQYDDRRDVQSPLQSSGDNEKYDLKKEASGHATAKQSSQEGCF